MDKYLALDRALNEILTPVPTPFSTLFAGEIKAECHRIAAGKAIRNRRIFLIAVCWRCVKQVKLIIQPEKGGLNEMVPFCHKLEEKLMTSNRCREIKTPPEHIIADYILRFMKNNKEAKLYEAMSRLESKIKLFVADGHDELHIRALLNQAAHSHTKESLKQACERICN